VSLGPPLGVARRIASAAAVCCFAAASAQGNRTGPVLVPEPQAAQATGEGQHRMHGRPARGNDCGRARATPSSAAGERRGGRPEGRGPPTFSPGLTSRLRARAHSCRGRRGGTCFCRCRCRSLQWPQGNWCCVAAPRPNLKSDQGSRAGPSRPWRRDEKPLRCRSGQG
jgi:hypothetical protein